MAGMSDRRTLRDETSLTGLTVLEVTVEGVTMFERRATGVDVDTVFWPFFRGDLALYLLEDSSVANADLDRFVGVLTAVTAALLMYSSFDRDMIDQLIL